MSTLGHLIAHIDSKIEALKKERSILENARDELDDLKERTANTLAMSPGVMWLEEHGYPNVIIPGGPYGHGTRTMIEKTTLYELAAARHNEDFDEEVLHKYPTEALFKPRLSAVMFAELIRYLKTGQDSDIVVDTKPTAAAATKRGASRSSRH
jgi:hypothetical protein